MDYIKIFLKDKKDKSLRRLHPWVFSGAIDRIDGTAYEGEIVEVYTKEKEYIATGIFHIGSIAIKIISFEQIEINDDFWRNKIQKAILYRQSLGFFDNSQTNIFRLIHGESDGLPGFIADYYNGVIVFQFHSLGLFHKKELFTEIVRDLLQDKVHCIYDKSLNSLPHKAEHPHKNSFLFGETAEIVGTEYGHKFHIDLLEGQKTGFFIDQRENRLLLQKYSKDKTVLNAFGYTGGFSVYAAGNGAKEVHTMDSSKRALEFAQKNIDLNFQNCNHQNICEDAFEFLSKIKGVYDLIVLDPPAFAKHLNVLKQGLKGYRTINQKAMAQIKPGGILFTFSCSQVVSNEEFRTMIFSAANDAKRNVRIMHQLSQPVDHPVSVFHPESEYLKGLVLHIE